MRSPRSARELIDFAPDWCLFWGGSLAVHHFDIWYPYLRRSRYRYALLAADGVIPEAVQARVDAMANCVALDGYVEPRSWLKECPGLSGFLHLETKAEIYSIVNAFRRHSHVWIGHGESEKRINIHRTASLYDSVFLAHYSALRRAPRAIRRWVRSGALAIGAAIVDGVEKRPWARPQPVRTLLYSPTWEGFRDTVDYSSLPDLGPALVAALPRLAADGITLVVRPHPWNGLRVPERRSIVDELYAAGAERPGTKAEDFELADAMISDVSGVTSEFLFTEKPSFMTTSARLDERGTSRAVLRARYPWAYLIDPVHDDIVESLRDLARDDPMRRARAAGARRNFRGHRSLDEAARTFDIALGVPRWRRSRMRIRLRWLFETRLLLARLGLDRSVAA